MGHSAAIRKIPKADLHRHAETYAQLDRLISRLNNQPAHDWESSIERLSELPPGMPRLTRLNGDLDTVAMHALAAKYAYFESWLTAVFEEAAHEGAVLVEVRFGVGDGLDPQHMYLFRQAESRVREKFPDFYAEAIAAIRLSALGEPDAFESCLRARDDGLAGIDFIPDPYDSEADWTGAYACAKRAAEAGLGITVHAGEFSTANIAAALRLPGVKRIGHGVHAAATEELLQLVLDSGVTVECCLTSNAVLGAVSSLDEHPIRTFVKAGVPVTLCSDDPVRLCTTIEREYELAAALNFGVDDLLSFTRQGVMASFTSEKRRSELLDVVESWSVPPSRQ